MVYVFDTNSFSILKDYYKAPFSKFWDCFNDAALKGEITSVREVYRELDGQVDRPHLQEWIKSNRDIFLPPSPEETQFLQDIFAVPHFQYLIKPKNLLVSTPFADPFVIASARVKQGCVVTEEKYKDHAARIPNVCHHFGIECTNLEGFIQKQNWQF